MFNFKLERGQPPQKLQLPLRLVPQPQLQPKLNLGRFNSKLQRRPSQKLQLLTCQPQLCRLPLPQLQPKLNLGRFNSKLQRRLLPILPLPPVHKLPQLHPQHLPAAWLHLLTPSLDPLLPQQKLKLFTTSELKQLRESY